MQETCAGHAAPTGALAQCHMKCKAPPQYRKLFEVECDCSPVFCRKRYDAEVSEKDGRLHEASYSVPLPRVRDAYLHAVDGLLHCEVINDFQQDLDYILSPIEFVVVQHHSVVSRSLSGNGFPGTSNTIDELCLSYVVRQ